MDTRDILNIALALSAVTITVFLAWLLYLTIAIVRDLRQTSRAIHEKVDQVGVILDSIRERIGDTVSTLTMLTQVIGKISERWREKKAKRSTKNSSDE